MPTKGIDIEFRNVTKGHHFDMVQDTIKGGGSLENLAPHDKQDFYQGKSIYTLTRESWGIKYTVKLTYDVSNDKLIAECDYY